MTKPQFTQAQRRAIDERGCDLLVSASAGSGKTTVMIERILCLLREGASLDAMAVCTFTKAAAADMREKLTRRLTEEAPFDARLTEQLRLLPQAEISTMHSWCSHIVRTYFYATDVDPNFEILDEAQSAALLTAAVEETIEAANEQGNADYLRLYDICLRGRKHKKLRDMVMRIYRYAYVQPDPAAWLQGCEDCLSGHDRAIKELSEISSRKGTALLGQVRDLATAVAAAGFDEEMPFVENLDAYLSGRTDELLRTPPRKQNHPCYDLHGVYRALRAQCDAWGKQRASWLHSADAARTRPYVRTLTALVREAADRYAAVKRRQARVDYEDLLHLTLAILGSDFRREVCKKYSSIFVDEYQDINPLQEAILAKFDSAMFFVGDVKQSIYGFRMCQPRFFVEKRKRFAEGQGGKTLELNANFRSDDQILQAVNTAFARLMREDFGGIDYRGSAMFEAGKAGPCRPAVQATLVRAPEKETTVLPPPVVYGVRKHTYEDGDDRFAAETDAVVRHVVQLLKGTLPDGERMRPVQNSDIAILVRSRDRYTQLLMRKLRAVGIPVSFADKADAEQSRTVRTLLSYLRLIDNRFDDVQLAAALRSPLGGFDDDELAALRGCGDREMFFYEAVDAAAAQDTPLGRRTAAFLQTLDRYRTLSRALRADELAGLVTAENNYFHHTAALGGEAECSMLASFLDSMTACPSVASLHEYLRYLGEAEQAVSLPADPDSVRLMTVHASKGLEFPFVLLCNLGHTFNCADLRADMLLSDDGIVLKYWNWETRAAEETALYALSALALKRQLWEEELRLLYVAMTRAQFGLSLFGTLPPSDAEDGDARCLAPEDCNSWLGWLLPDLLRFATVVSAESCRIESDVPVRRPVFTKPDLALTDCIARRLEFCDKGEHRALKTNVTRLAEQAEAESPVVYTAGGEGDDRALETGNAYHRMMQHLNFAAPFDAEWDRLCTLLPECAVLCDRDRIRAAWQNVAPLAAQADSVLREQAFVLNDNGILVQGVIDLLLIQSGKATVIDYKTTSEQGLRAQGYRTQMEIYCRAVSEILGVTVERRLLYAFRLDDFVEI